MAYNEGPVIQGAILRGELVRLRLERGLTQRQVADSLEWSSAKIIRIEGGHSSITKVDLDALLTQYENVSDSRRARLHALNREARKRGWWATYRHIIDDAFLSYVGYETGAAFIRQFSGAVVPALLQTPEYARALIDISVDSGRSGAIVDLRLQRQSELALRSVPPRRYYVLDEAAIWRHVGLGRDPGIMPDQLRYIANRVQDDDLLTVRVIPFQGGEYAGMPTPFTLLEFEGGLPDRLYFTVGRETIVVVNEQDRVAEYRDTFEILLEQALSANTSIDLIRTAAEDIAGGRESSQADS